MKNKLTCIKNNKINFIPTKLIYELGGGHEVRTEDVKANEIVHDSPVKPGDAELLGDQKQAKGLDKLKGAASAADKLADGADGDKEKKDKIDLSVIPGYPDKVAELKNNSKEYKSVLEQLLTSLKEKLKRDPVHGSMIESEINGNHFILIIDKYSDPKERIFKAQASAIAKEAGSKEEDDTTMPLATRFEKRGIDLTKYTVVENSAAIKIIGKENYDMVVKSITAENYKSQTVSVDDQEYLFVNDNKKIRCFKTKS